MYKAIYITKDKIKSNYFYIGYKLFSYAILESLWNYPGQLMEISWKQLMDMSW